MSRSTDVGVIVIRILDEVLDRCLDQIDEETEKFLQLSLSDPTKYRSGYVPMAEAKDLIQKLGSSLRDLVYNTFSEAYPEITENIKTRLDKTIHALGELQQNVELLQKTIADKENIIERLKSENQALIEHEKQLEDYIEQLKQYYENIIQQLQQQLQALKEATPEAQLVKQESLQQQVKILNEEWQKRYQELEKRYQILEQERDELRQALQLKNLADRMTEDEPSQ